MLVIAVAIGIYKNDWFQELLLYLDTYDAVVSSRYKLLTRWRLTLPFIFGVTCAEVTVLRIAMNYIPSTVCTILQYRSGGLGTLHSEYFSQKLRVAVDQSTLLFGGMFWGTLIAAIFIGLFWGVFLGFFLWPDFAQLALLAFSSILGALITILVKWAVLIGFLANNQKAFYRKSVVKANVVGVILQAWNLGLTSAFVLWRSIRLFFAAMMFIGRIDVPFLSDRASSLGAFDHDLFPIIFRKELMSKEAHRHPYLERLGVMYLMKLRHDDFGSYAGTCWRMLFVYALMPWMRKYRVRQVLDKAPLEAAANVLIEPWTGKFVEHGISKVVDNQKVDEKVAVLMSEIEMLKKENDRICSLLYEEQRAFAHSAATKEEGKRLSLPSILGSEKIGYHKVSKSDPKESDKFAILTEQDDVADLGIPFDEQVNDTAEVNIDSSSIIMSQSPDLQIRHRHSTHL